MPRPPFRPAAAVRSARFRALVLALFVTPSARLAAQRPTTIVVRPNGTDSVVLAAADFARLARHEVRATEHGRASTFAGVWLRDALRAGGVRVDSLRGPALAGVVMAEATDGYRVAFALGELAPDLGGREVLLADRRDGAALAAEEGPYRLVVAQDGRPARWVRGVRAFTLLNAPPRPGAAPSAAPRPPAPPAPGPAAPGAPPR